MYQMFSGDLSLGLAKNNLHMATQKPGVDWGRERGHLPLVRMYRNAKASQEFSMS